MRVPQPFSFPSSCHTNGAPLTGRTVLLICSAISCAASCTAVRTPSRASTIEQKYAPRETGPGRTPKGRASAASTTATFAPQSPHTGAAAPPTAAAREAAAPAISGEWQLQFERFTRYIDEAPQWRDDGSVWHEELGWLADGTAALPSPATKTTAARDALAERDPRDPRDPPAASQTPTYSLIALASTLPTVAPPATLPAGTPPAAASSAATAWATSAAAPAAASQERRLVRVTSSDGACLIRPAAEGLRIAPTATVLPNSSATASDYIIRFSDLGNMRIVALALGPRCESLAIIAPDHFRVAERPRAGHAYHLGPPLPLWTPAAAQTDEDSPVIHAAFHPSGTRLAIAGPTLVVMQRLDSASALATISTRVSTVANTSALDLSSPGAPLVTRPLNAPGFGQLGPTTQLASTPRILWQLALPQYPGETLQLTEVPFADVTEPLARKALHVAMARWFAKWQQGMRPRMSAVKQGNGRTRAAATSASGSARYLTASNPTIQGIDACEYALDGDQRFRVYTRLVVDTSARRAFVLRAVGNGWTRRFAAYTARLVPKASEFAFAPPQRHNLDCSR